MDTFLCYLANKTDREGCICSKQSFLILLLKNQVLVRVGSPRLYSLPTNTLECRDGIRLILIDSLSNSFPKSLLLETSKILVWIISHSNSTGKWQGSIFRWGQDYFRKQFWLYHKHKHYNVIHVTLKFKLLKSGIFVHFLYCYLED